MMFADDPPLYILWADFLWVGELWFVRSFGDSGFSCDLRGESGENAISNRFLLEDCLNGRSSPPYRSF